MATIGQAGESKFEEEKILAYLERIQLLFTANSIADEKKLRFTVSCWSRDLFSSTRFVSANQTTRSHFTFDYVC